jgi:hypothetical protein
MKVLHIVAFSANATDPWSQLEVRADRPSAEHGHGTNLFVGSAGGGRSAAIAYTLIQTAKLNGVDPQAWLTVTVV